MSYLKKNLITIFFTLSLCTSIFSQDVTRYIILGPPGSGKGTLANNLSKKTSLPVITISQLLKNCPKQDPACREIHENMQKGILIDDNHILNVLKKELKKPIYHKGYIFDGYPRTLAQAQQLAQEKLQITHVLIVNISHQEIIERLSKRLVHSPSGRTYHTENAPPKIEGLDDITQEPLTKRADDHPSVVKERLKTYEKQTKPIITWAIQKQQSQDGSIQQISYIAANPNPEFTYQNACEKLKLACH